MSTLVTVRYRDINWEEAKKCLRLEAHEGGKEVWEKKRGTPIVIETPAYTDMAYRMPSSDFICEGPMFKTTTPSRIDGIMVYVCPHMAEIGD